MLAQKLAIVFECLALAENFEIALKAVIQHIPQLFALGREVERLETLFNVLAVDKPGDGVLRLAAT